MTESFEDARRRQDLAAKRRLEQNADQRQRTIEAFERPGGLAEVNTPVELAQRLDRLSRYYARAPLPASSDQVPEVEAAPEAAIEAALARAPTPVGEEAAAQPSAFRAGVVLEKVFETPEFLDVRYFEAGVAASRAVCRIDIRDASARRRGYGTGSLVSPRLLLTNHHVLPDAEIARASTAEFDYQDGVDGRPLPVRALRFDPDAFFVNDAELDFALVAVAGSERDLAGFGMNPLIEAQGKAIKGDYATIVQHPRGERKQVALRENRIVDELDLFLHYQADTEPGSSGSPVFNDQWEIVALHHASVETPAGGAERFLNEGVRASRILRHLAKQRLPPAQQALVEQLRAAGPIVVAPVAGDRTPTGGVELSVAGAAAGEQPLSWSIPLELTIGLRAAQPAVQAPPAAPVPVPAPAPAEPALEALVEPFREEDYSNRRGYDPDFLGIQVPLPQILDESVVSRLDGGSPVLSYEHFSVVMHKARRLALFTASNVDAAAERKRPEPGRDYTRRGLTGLDENDQEKWFTDPRIPAIHQLPDRFFTKDRKAFDKGHIVRREDVVWGDSFEEVRRANGDTFHVTNCSPQVADFNRSNKQGAWGKLENLILDQAETERYCVFAGPVFGEEDRPFSGVDDAGPVSIPIPEQFWKVVVARSGDALETFAFVLDQDLSNVDFEFAVDAEWRTRMVSVADLERRLGTIRFPEQLHASDQIDASPGEAIRGATGIEVLSG